MNKKDNFPFWTDEWMKSQQEYLDTWTDMSEKMSGAFQPIKKPINPWVDALDQWETLLPNTGESQPYAQRMLDQGKAFFEMSEGISKFLKMLNDVNKSKDKWENTLESQMEEIKKAFETGEGNLSAFWDKPINSWKSSIGNSAIDPSIFNKFFDQKQSFEDLSNPVYDEMNKFLSTPGVGPDRESQEKYQNYLRLWMEYNRAFQEYNSAHHRVGKETIERLIAKTAEISKDGDTLESMREIYDLWIDCAEEAYSDFAFSDEYQTVYAHMINSLMALKQSSRSFVDDAVASIGLPTSKAFDTVLKRLQEMRREIRQLQKEKQQSASEGMLELRNEISELRKEVASLKANDKTSKPATKKKVSKKKVTSTKKS